MIEKLHNLHTTLWKLRNFTATVFRKFSVKSTRNVLLKNFTVNWFDEKIFVWQWISRFSTLFVHHSEKIFRQIISLVISLAKPYLSRIFYQTCVSVNFWNYHTVCIPHCGNTGNLPPLQKSFVKSIHSVTLTKFLQKKRGGKIFKYTHCAYLSVEITEIYAHRCMYCLWSN